VQSDTLVGADSDKLSIREKLGPFFSFLLLFAMFHAKICKSKAQLTGSSKVPQNYPHVMATIATLRFAKLRKIKIHLFPEGIRTS
jgi:hypothetical protein